MTKFFADAVTGAYIGGFDGVTVRRPVAHEGGLPDFAEFELWPELPANGIEVATPPANALQLWDGAAWRDTPEMLRTAAVAELSDSDKRMARVGEDVIALLIGKGIITIDELPDYARELLIARDEARGKL